VPAAGSRRRQDRPNSQGKKFGMVSTGDNESTDDAIGERNADPPFQRSYCRKPAEPRREAELRLWLLLLRLRGFMPQGWTSRRQHLLVKMPGAERAMKGWGRTESTFRR
jgi:hypothetical protein